MSESQYSLRPRKQLDYAQVNAGKTVQFPAYGFSPDRTHDEPVGEFSSQDITTEDFTELQRLLDQEKEKNKVLEATSKLEQMRILAYAIVNLCSQYLYSFCFDCFVLLFAIFFLFCFL